MAQDAAAGGYLKAAGAGCVPVLGQLVACDLIGVASPPDISEHLDCICKVPAS